MIGVSSSSSFWIFAAAALLRAEVERRRCSPSTSLSYVGFLKCAAFQVPSLCSGA